MASLFSSVYKHLGLSLLLGFVFLWGFPCVYKNLNVGFVFVFVLPADLSYVSLILRPSQRPEEGPVLPF